MTLLLIELYSAHKPYRVCSLLNVIVPYWNHKQGCHLYGLLPSYYMISRKYPLYVFPSCHGHVIFFCVDALACPLPMTYMAVVLMMLPLHTFISSQKNTWFFLLPITQSFQVSTCTIPFVSRVLRWSHFLSGLSWEPLCIACILV